MVRGDVEPLDQFNFINNIKDHTKQNTNATNASVAYSLSSEYYLHLPYVHTTFSLIEDVRNSSSDLIRPVGLYFILRTFVGGLSHYFLYVVVGGLCWWLLLVAG
jgi:hypothetical protein